MTAKGDPMLINADQYKDVLRHVPCGVTIVTSRQKDERRGMTASAVVSVSAEPPLVAVVIDQGHSINPLLNEPDACLAINVLSQTHEALANRFAFVKDQDRFAEGNWTTAETGAPVLADAIAWLDCTIENAHPAGSHTIYVAAVCASRVVAPDAAPLVYWNRDYRAIR